MKSPEYYHMICIGKTKYTSITSNSVIPNSILRRQIRKHQILSRDIKFGNTKLYQATSNLKHKILSLRTQKRKSVNFKSWYPVLSSMKAWLKCTEDNHFPRKDNLFRSTTIWPKNSRSKLLCLFAGCWLVYITRELTILSVTNLSALFASLIEDKLEVLVHQDASS